MPGCRTCGAEMFWVRLASGKLVPTDSDRLEREARPLDVVTDGMIGYVVSGRNLAETERRLHDDETLRLHASHFETCAGAVNHRDGGLNPSQERMDL